MLMHNIYIIQAYTLKQYSLKPIDGDTYGDKYGHSGHTLEFCNETSKRLYIQEKAKDLCSTQR